MARVIKYNVHVPTYLTTFIVVLAVLGFAISTYAFLHFHAFASGSVCNISATFNCDVVNRGPYSSIAGIPIALIGMAGYAFLAIAGFMQRRHPEERPLSVVLIAATSLAFLFSLYLTAIEVFILEAFCILCLTSLLIITLILFASFWLRSETERYRFLEIHTRHLHEPKA